MNIYYDPEKLGLELFSELEFSSGSYEYDTLIVLRDTTTNKLYYAEDSGCSCPTPFEYVSIADLHKNPIDMTTIASFVSYVEGRVKDAYSYSGVDKVWQSECRKVYNHIKGTTLPSFTTEGEKWGDTNV